MAQPAASSACHAVLPHLKGTQSNKKGWGRGHTVNRAPKQCVRCGGERPDGPSACLHLSHAESNSQVENLRKREQATWPKAPQPGSSRQGTPEPAAKTVLRASTLPAHVLVGRRGQVYVLLPDAER